MTTNTPATATAYTPSDHDSALREKYAAERDAAQADFEGAQARAMMLEAKLITARSAQAQRLAALAMASAQAQDAATTTLTAGAAEASDEETRAAFAAWNAEQEAQRAAGALAGLEAELQSAIAERTRLSTVWAEADKRAQLHERQMASAALLTAWQALETQLHELVARTRAHNADVRATWAGAAICLPGRVLASARRSAREANADGFILRPALDLTTGVNPDAHLSWRDIGEAIERGRIAE